MDRATRTSWAEDDVMHDVNIWMTIGTTFYDSGCRLLNKIVEFIILHG